MVKALFDTNILVDYLNAVPEARTELQRYTEKAVSIITWMEVMVGATGDVEVATRSFLSSFDAIALDAAYCRARRQPSPQASHQIAQCNHFGNSAGTRDALGHTKYERFLGRRSWRPYALQIVSYRDDECRSEARKYFCYAYLR